MLQKMMEPVLSYRTSDPVAEKSRLDMEEFFLMAFIRDPIIP